MRKRLYLLLAFLWMGVCMLSAQTKNVSGRILSAENDEPIAGIGQGYIYRGGF